MWVKFSKFRSSTRACIIYRQGAVNQREHLRTRVGLFRDARGRKFRLDYGSTLIWETTFIRVGAELTQQAFTDEVESVPTDATMLAES